VTLTQGLQNKAGEEANPDEIEMEQEPAGMIQIPKNRQLNAEQPDTVVAMDEEMMAESSHP